MVQSRGQKHLPACFLPEKFAVKESVDPVSAEIRENAAADETVRVMSAQMV